MSEWLYGAYWVAGVVFFYLITSACLRRHSDQVDDQASLIPFADDPVVARRVEQAHASTGGKPQLPICTDHAGGQRQ